MICRRNWLVATIALSTSPLLFAACSPQTDAPPADTTFASSALGTRMTAGGVDTVLRAATGCTIPGPCEVPIIIQLLDSTVDVGHDKPPGKDRVVALIKNAGQYTTTMYGFRPSSQALYFLRLKAGPSPRATWRIAEFSIEEERVDHNFLRGAIMPCHTFEGEKPSAVGFKNCDEPYESTSRARRMSMLGFTVAPLSLLRRHQDTTTQKRGEDPLWISCASGCCTMQQQS